MFLFQIFLKITLSNICPTFQEVIICFYIVLIFVGNTTAFPPACNLVVDLGNTQRMSNLSPYLIYGSRVLSFHRLCLGISSLDLIQHCLGISTWCNGWQTQKNYIYVVSSILIGNPYFQPCAYKLTLFHTIQLQLALLPLSLSLE